MAYDKINKRTIRLFAATPEELAKNRPNLNGTFIVSLEDLHSMLDDMAIDGEVAMAISVWRRKGKEGKPDYFSAEITVPPADRQAVLIKKEHDFLKANPRTDEDAKRKRDYAMNQAAAKRAGLESAHSDDFLPF